MDPEVVIFPILWYKVAFDSCRLLHSHSSTASTLRSAVCNTLPVECTVPVHCQMDERSWAYKHTHCLGDKAKFIHSLFFMKLQIYNNLHNYILMVLENLELIRLELNLPMLNLLFSDIIALFVIRNNTHQLYQLFNSYKILSAYKPKKKLHPKSYHFPIWLTRSQIGIGSPHLFLASQHQSGLLLSTSFSLQVPC